MFSFVGVIVVYGRVLKCYPKYINSCGSPVVQMKQIMRVLEKYNSKEQVIKLYNESDDGGSFNLLAVMLYLLQDYYDNGIYANDVGIVETNGTGEILWDRTINETFSYISNNRPYYTELQTKKRTSDEYDFIRRLHACVLTKFSKELEESDLPELFNIVTVELSEEQLEDLGDEDYILYRIQNELNVQYNTRKQLVLKAMYAYIAQKASFNNIDSFSIYGTNSFNLVWEKVCAQNFGNVLNVKLSELPLGVCDDYKESKDSTLIEIIDRPVWHKTSDNISDEKSDTLRPDLISIYECGDSGEYCFGIYDAKYYNINFHKHASEYKVIGQPGVADVTKQYLYQLAYDDFIAKQGYKYVQNMFFCPDESGDKEYGWVQMDMLHQIGDKKLENVAVVKLCASEMYSLYLADHIVSENEMDKYIPVIGRHEVDSQNFANRMMAYLTRITTASKLAEKKLEMKSDRGNDTVVNEECMSKIRKEVSSQKKIIDEKFKKYPQFLFPIFRNDIHEIVDYKQLILELDDTFNISRIYKDTISNSSRGIIYISSNFVDYNLGIEWRSINAFMFNESKIVKNIVKVSSDTDDSSLFTSNIISLDEIADADYEMNNRLQEQESEDYYEHIVKGEYDEIDDNYGFSYDVILLKDNDFYEIFDVEGEIIEDVIENNDFLRGYKFFNNIAVPDRYKGERFVFGKSELYQDGILLEFNPQCIVPIGVGYVIVNLTAESRLELNVSRHELNNNREIISKWNKRVGCVVQKKVAENCIRVLKENNLDFKIEDLLSQNVEGFFEKECLFNMKDILRELLM